MIVRVSFDSLCSSSARARAQTPSPFPAERSRTFANVIYQFDVSVLLLTARRRAYKRVSCTHARNASFVRETGAIPRGGAGRGGAPVVFHTFFFFSLFFSHVASRGAHNADLDK